MKTKLRLSGSLLILLLSLSAFSQYAQLSKLVSSDAEGNTSFGTALAISADSSTLVVGGPNAYSYTQTGGAWVYVRQGNSWVQQAFLAGTVGIGVSAQGTSVAISADGNTVVLGAPFDNDSLGACWVFVRSGTTWTQQAKLASNNVSSAACQGFAVAMSYDGNTILAGAPRDADSIGCGLIFKRIGINWNEETKLLGSGWQGKCWQGKSIALSADGNTAILMGAGYSRTPR